MACDPSPTNLPTVYTISGQVLDAQNQGVASVKIKTSLANETTTDADGNWSLSDLSSVQTVIATSDSYEFSPAEFVVSSAQSGLIFRATKVMSDEEILISSWFNQQQLPNGLLESTENGNLVSLYDNALAALVFLSYGDVTRAERIFDFFNGRIDSEFLVGNGGFSQMRDKNGVPNNHRWMGDNAWLLMALNNYETLTGSQKYNRLSTEISNWLINLQDVDGGVWGGFDANNNQIHKITEGNVDAFNAVKGYTIFHQKLLDFLENERWDDADKNLIAWVGNAQYFYAMDLHPWGFCAFEDFPTSVLTSADRYLTTQTATINNKLITGYCFDIDKDVVWLEGTGEMVVAFNTAEMFVEADFYLKEMEKMIFSSTAFPNAAAIPYATNMGTSYGNGQLWAGVDTKPAISACAWYLFGKHQFDPFAVQHKKNIPVADKFWL